MLGGDELTENGTDDTPFHDDDLPCDHEEHDPPETGDVGELIGAVTT